MIKQAPFSFAITILGITVALYFIFDIRFKRALRKLGEGAETATAQVRDSGNSTATGGSVNLHVHPPVSVTPAVPQKVEDDPTPGIAMTRYENDLVDLYSIPSRQLRSEDVDSLLLTAVFVNPRLGIGQRTPTADRVHAQLTFRYSDQQETNIHYGHWIGCYTHFARFGAGTYQHLAVALRSKKGVLYSLENPNSFDPRLGRVRSGVRVLHGPNSVLLIEDVRSVEIALINGETTLFQREFTLVQDPDGLMRLE